MFRTARLGLLLWLVGFWWVGLVVAMPAIGQVGAPRSRVLITNDNGIDDEKIVALARAFAKRAETWVLAPSGDRSGGGSHLTVTRRPGVEAEPRDLGSGIKAFAVDGYPADCVVLAVAGLMLDAPPDLIVSGINGGDNAGSDWMFSGTVGAARVAAFVGIPAIAVSGLDDDIRGAVDAAVAWVVRLAESQLVRSLAPGEYLTVSLPRVAPAQIRGVRVTDRAPLRIGPQLEVAQDGVSWSVAGLSELGLEIPSDSDEAALAAGYIAVVPMQVGDVDLQRLAEWRRLGTSLPEWSVP